MDNGKVWAQGMTSPGTGEADADAVVIARSIEEPECFAAVFRRHAPQI
jgi:hypothetical protein